MGPEVMAGASLASSAFSAFGAISGGQSQKAQADYNARGAEINAQQSIAAATSDAEDIRREGRRKQGTATVAYGAGGVVPNEGSAYEVLVDNAGEIELDARRRLFRGDMEARGYRQQEAQDYQRGQAAETAGYMKAGAGLLEGGVKTATLL